MNSELTDHEIETTDSEYVSQFEKDKQHVILENLQAALGISIDELNAMLHGEHFNHQY